MYFLRKIILCCFEADSYVRCLRIFMSSCCLSARRTVAFITCSAHDALPHLSPKAVMVTETLSQSEVFLLHVGTVSDICHSN